MAHRFIVNTLGEAYRGNEALVSSVNVVEIARKTFSADEYDQWIWTMGRNNKLEKNLERAIKREFRRLAKENLKPDELLIWDAYGQLNKLSDSRFRIYGGITARGKLWMKLVTEFKNFIDEKDFWKKLVKFQRLTKAKWWTMCEEPHLHTYSPAKNIPGEKLNVEESTKDTKFFNGPNHGRMEKQVELSWNVYGMTVPQVRKYIKELAKLSQDVWDEAGVGVI